MIINEARLQSHWFNPLCSSNASWTYCISLSVRRSGFSGVGERGRKEEGKKQEIKDEWGKMEGGSGGKEQRRTVIKERR